MIQPEEKMEKKIKEIIDSAIKLSIPIEEIKEEDDLVAFGLNSLNGIRIIVKLEKEYNIKFADEDLVMESIQTIKKIKEYISKKDGY